MRVLENGDYQLDDGRVIRADQVAKQYSSAPKVESKLPVSKPGLELSEGQSSGRIQLED
jgi:hypothetical protein